jgi:hypothetical protein
MRTVRQLAKFGFIAVMLCSANSFAQDTHNDGPGDTPENPDIWVTPTEGGGAIYTPGDNQPVDVTREGNREILNYDTQPDPSSDIVITADPPSDGQ